MRVVAFMALLLSMCLSVRGSELHPLVLIPGSGGNQLEARLTEAYKPSSLVCCLSAVERRIEGWFRLWFDPTVLVAPLTRCFAERMTLYYHGDIDDYRNAPGVETRVPYFGSTQGLLYLDPNLKFITNYMATLVDSLEEIGYEDGHNLFGAPYDFRYGLASEGHPSQVGTQYLQDLRQLIEAASAANGGKPVILLSHSLGGLFALQLLVRNPLTWRRKYIKHLVTLSAPWAGTVQEMLTFASGYTLGIPIVDPLLVRGEQRSSESNLWLLPSPTVFGNKPLVMAPNKTYSAYDMPQFLKDIGYNEGVIPYNTRILPMTDRLMEPGVPVTCMVGIGIETPEVLFYGTEGFDVQPEMVYGDGDGTVNMISLLALESEWADSASQVLKVIKLPGVSHTSILKDGAALKEIIGEIRGINSVSLSSVL
ncbi:lecithin-cholesterol acyltransferase-like 1 [Cocos nucifera]|uniref:Lecithin-cholesterol acyltransferase-like 1 n=1 Tax=Cocos nucifera TaxID=13894 RepID=A0A8K0N123_COCNU|nr:lecithin-cholesterol acyltransferase-like 1 [Cocos nucifera]KAG1341817.1 lecithin-cholesterol acyltransferase-like 1 [Cocos nucifera]